MTLNARQSSHPTSLWGHYGLLAVPGTSLSRTLPRVLQLRQDILTCRYAPSYGLRSLSVHGKAMLTQTPGRSTWATCKATQEPQPVRLATMQLSISTQTSTGSSWTRCIRTKIRSETILRRAKQPGITPRSIEPSSIDQINLRSTVLRPKLVRTVLYLCNAGCLCCPAHVAIFIESFIESDFARAVARGGNASSWERCS